jgi:cyanate permease
MVPMAPLLIGACFGRAVVGKVAGMQAGLGLPFLLAAAPLVGAVRDETGEYFYAFVGLAGLLLFAASLIALTRVPKRA